MSMFLNRQNLNHEKHDLIFVSYIGLNKLTSTASLNLPLQKCFLKIECEVGFSMYQTLA